MALLGIHSLTSGSTIGKHVLRFHRNGRSRSQSMMSKNFRRQCVRFWSMIRWTSSMRSGQCSTELETPQTLQSWIPFDLNPWLRCGIATSKLIAIDTTWSRNTSAWCDHRFLDALPRSHGVVNSYSYSLCSTCLYYRFIDDSFVLS